MTMKKIVRGERQISKAGIKIKNIKAGTLYSYNLGLRDRYDYSDGVFSNSLFSDFLIKNGMDVYKGESTRDLICIDFDFGSRSYEEEMGHLKKLLERAQDPSVRERIESHMAKAEKNKFKYCKRSKAEIRELFYQNGVSVKYFIRDKHGAVKKEDLITYKMLYRNSSKAKIGQVMFINERLYDIAYDWLTMGLGKKMPADNAKIVEMSAYAPLTTSTIVDTLPIPVEDILILQDQDSFFQTISSVVRAENYKGFERVLDEEKTEAAKQRAIKNHRVDILGNPIYKKVYRKVAATKKRCVVTTEKTQVKNTLWDGMGLIESSVLPEWVNGMALLRSHFFKMCGFRTKIQKFFQDWCERNGYDYETYTVMDMFGLPHRLKDIKIITTDNAVKWKKFIDLMGGSPLAAYQYWCGRICADGSVFGVVKTDHRSKLGNVQQMSYQMINTLPCSYEDVWDIARTSMDYVECLKKDNTEFERFLRKNANHINHYEMMADLYHHNHEFANSAWFRSEKRKIINQYVFKLRSGKITVEGDNLTMCGNPYALLLYAVGEEWQNDPCFSAENGAIQCYTTRFDDGAYLGAFRSPHNSPNNVCYLHNRHSVEMKRYFDFSDNIIAVNCIKTDIQDRTNGSDYDSDFLFVTNQPTVTAKARQCYEEFPTIVNKLKESGVTYQNTLMAYANMDNKFAHSKRGIGESSNLAQLALTYYWNTRAGDLYDNFVILSVLAQCIIDGCKREYEVDALAEIDRIKHMDCMKLTGSGGDKCDLPLFMLYTKSVDTSKNGTELSYDEVRGSKDRIKRRINQNLSCPMNYLQQCLGKIQGARQDNATPTKAFFIKMDGKANDRQITKIQKLVNEYDNFIRLNHSRFGEESFFFEFEKVTSVFLDHINKIRIGNIVTINRIIEISLSVDRYNNNPHCEKKYQNNYARRMLNTLYRQNRDKFLMNFVQNG